MAVSVALLLAAVFGGGIQYLGSLSAHPWATEVSLLSAPWLAVPFLAGWTRRDPRSGALLGLACTIAALVGYGLMTLSPVENAELSLTSVAGFMRSQSLVFLGGLFTGSLFGWLGYRWGADRAWPGALALGLAFCLEPLVLASAGDPIAVRAVWMAEIVVGIVIAAYVVAETLAARHGSRSTARA